MCEEIFTNIRDIRIEKSAENENKNGLFKPKNEGELVRAHKLGKISLGDGCVGSQW